MYRRLSGQEGDVLAHRFRPAIPPSPGAAHRRERLRIVAGIMASRAFQHATSRLSSPSAAPSVTAAASS
jgi:hypothetical protein